MTRLLGSLFKDRDTQGGCKSFNMGTDRYTGLFSLRLPVRSRGPSSKGLESRKSSPESLNLVS